MTAGIDGYKFYKRGWRNGHYYEEWIADDYDDDRDDDDEDYYNLPPEYDGDDD